MKKSFYVLLIFFAAGLSGCGNQFKLSPLADDSRASLGGETKVVSASETMMADLESNLRGVRVVNSSQSKLQVANSAKALSLSDSEVAVIMATAQNALANAGLLTSNDLSQIIPVIVQGASLGVGSLGQSDSSFLSNILAAVGNSALNSIVNVSDSSASTNLLGQLANSLFMGFSSSGVSSTNITSIANNVISSLLGRLNESNLATGGFSSILQSLASGTVTGLGQLGLPSNLFSTVLNSLGSGSLSGLTNLVTNVLGSVTSSSGSNWLSTLLNSFTTGISSALSSISGGSSITNLLGAFLGGVSNGASTGTPAASNPPTNTNSSGGVSSIINIVGSLLSLWLL